MRHQCAFPLLRSHFDTAAHLRWLSAGGVVGLCAWRWGGAPISAWGLQLVTGFGATLVVPLLLAIVLAIVARTRNNRAGTLAYGDFRNLQPWLLAKMLRAASAFMGVAAVATVCWYITGSAHALATALLGVWFAGVFAYCWAGMVIIADDLIQTRVAS